MFNQSNTFPSTWRFLTESTTKLKTCID